MFPYLQMRILKYVFKITMWVSKIVYIKHLAQSEYPVKGSYVTTVVVRLIFHLICLSRWKLHNDTTKEIVLAKSMLFSFWKFNNNNEVITRAKKITKSTLLGHYLVLTLCKFWGTLNYILARKWAVCSCGWDPYSKTILHLGTQMIRCFVLGIY